MLSIGITFLGIAIYTAQALPTSIPDLGSSTTPDMSPPDITELDIAFIMDTTGSMGSYINNAKQNIHQVVTEIVQSSPLDVQMALIEYRDHSDQSDSFIVRQHDFTRSIRTMESWLGASRASGGGDTPEAVADALDIATKLSWRQHSAKISVLISDAPPHGLDSPIECPLGFDPMEIVRKLAHIDVTLYSVGCEPAISPYTDYFMALAYLTGGQYIPLNDPRHLIDAIIGGAQEELSLQKFSELVKQEIQKALAQSHSASGNRTVNETDIIQSVYHKLSNEGATATRLVYNNQTLAGPSDKAKAIAECKSMADVRKIFHHRPSSGYLPYPHVYFGTPLPGATYAPTYAPGRPLPSMAGLVPTASPLPTMAVFPTVVSGIVSGSGVMFGPSGSMTGSSSGSYSSIHTAIGVDQIGRLVNKELSKLSVST